MQEQRKTSRALEIVYFACVDIPVKEGRLYMFMAIDDFSTVIFSLNSALELTDAMCIDAVKEFLAKDDVKSAGQGVQIVVPFKESLRDSIEELLRPHDGFVSFSPAVVNRVAGPIIKEALRGREYKFTY